MNGSPNEKGCTYTALQIVSDMLNEQGVETQLFQLGNKPISGCIACRSCSNTGKCAFSDKVNEFSELASEADGFVFGSPVHYASITGAMASFMDRLFFSSPADTFALKPAACLVSARRAGTTAALEQLLKYPTISQMPVVSSRYWNMVHGNQAADVEKDEEGMQIMRYLGRNMAWLLKSIEAGKSSGVSKPIPEEKRIATNFIR